VTVSGRVFARLFVRSLGRGRSRRRNISRSAKEVDGGGRREKGRERETVASREGGTRGTLERAGRGSFLAFLLLLGPREQEPASKEEKKGERVEFLAGPGQGRSRAGQGQGNWADLIYLAAGPATTVWCVG
jgi:hypothetical protein